MRTNIRFGERKAWCEHGRGCWTQKEGCGGRSAGAYLGRRPGAWRGSLGKRGVRASKEGVELWGRLGSAGGPEVGGESGGAAARSHRAEVRRALAAYRASDAAEREAATEAGEQAPAEAAGAQGDVIFLPRAQVPHRARLAGSAFGRGGSGGRAARRPGGVEGGPEARGRAGDSPLSRARPGPSPR